MTTKYKKEKEAIRTQIHKKVRYYVKSKGITFFYNETPVNNKLYTIDDNDIEVLLIKLNRTKKVLITTKCLFIIYKNKSHRIDGDTIESFDYLEMSMSYDEFMALPKLQKAYIRYKVNFRIGKYRIIKKDGSYIDLNSRRTRFSDCLNDSIKKLKFVVNKYEGT